MNTSPCNQPSCKLRAVTIALGQLLALTAAAAECPHAWQPDSPAGADDRVDSLSDYNGQLIAGGYFQNIGGVSAKSIARRDAAGWYPLGTGVENGQFRGEVIALQSYNGDLVAGGTFTIAGGFPASNIARWNGDEWTELATGLDARCTALAQYNGDLIAGGWFWTAGGQTARYVARWDGVSWSPMGAEVNSVPLAFVLYNNQLVAGGYFHFQGAPVNDSVARWNGTAWEPLGHFPGTYAACFAIYHNQLYAGEVSGLNYYTHIYRWDDPNWTEIGEFSDTGDDYGVYSLTVHNDELVATSDATNIAGENVHYIARWNGTTWRPLDTGLNSSALTLFPFNGDLFAGGFFTEAGDRTAIHIARWSPILPAITQQPQRQLTYTGQQASFSIEATDAQNYQWRRNAQNLTDDARITGSSTPMLIISQVSLADRGNYDCVLTNTCGSTTSNPAPLRVIAAVPGPPTLSPIATPAGG